MYAPESPLGPRRPWLAALLSLLRPGLGQVYAGDLPGGLVVAALNLVLPLAVALGWAAAPFGVTPLLVLLALTGGGAWLVGIFWAWRTARRAGTGPGQKYQSPVGYVVFFVGTYFASQLATGWVRDEALDAFTVPGSSMAPALLEGDWILVRKVGEAAAPTRGKVGVFYVPESGEEPKRMLPHVKRVVALGGDVVEISGGRIRVDGKDLGPAGDRDAPLKLVVPAEHFFALGDQRGESADSRSYGPVADAHYVGRVEAIYFSVGSEGARWERIGRGPESR